MATLHIVNSPPDHGAALSHCLRAATQGDTVLLIGNGVLCAVSAVFARAAPGATELSWYALSDDIESRGIANHIAASIRQVDDGVFVDLVATHQPIVSWS